MTASIGLQEVILRTKKGAIITWTAAIYLANGFAKGELFETECPALEVPNLFIDQ
jgi:hypothetical protein